MDFYRAHASFVQHCQRNYIVLEGKKAWKDASMLPSQSRQSRVDRILIKRNCPAVFPSLKPFQCSRARLHNSN